MREKAITTLRSVIILLLWPILLQAEPAAGLRIDLEPGGFVSLLPNLPTAGQVFLVERSRDLVRWEPVMPARTSRVDDPVITLPVSGATCYYRLILDPARDAALIPVDYNTLGLGPGLLLGKFEVTVGEWKHHCHLSRRVWL